MFGYEALTTLSEALITFFYEPGDLLPLDQPGGLEELEQLLGAFKTEVSRTLLNHKDKKLDLYLAELEQQADELISPFGELFRGLLVYPEALAIRQRVPSDEGGNYSAYVVLDELRRQLMIDGIELERKWTGGSLYYPDAALSAAFFARLTSWQKLSMRYKTVQNTVYAITSHLASKKAVLGRRQAILAAPVALPSEKPEPARQIDRVKWEGTAQEFAEFLYLAEKAGELNLKELSHTRKLRGAIHKLCEGWHFTQFGDRNPAEAVYNALLKVPTNRLGVGAPDYPRKTMPWGQRIIELGKQL